MKKKLKIYNILAIIVSLGALYGINRYFTLKRSKGLAAEQPVGPPVLEIVTPAAVNSGSSTKPVTPVIIAEAKKVLFTGAHAILKAAEAYKLFRGFTTYESRNKLLKEFDKYDGNSLTMVYNAYFRLYKRSMTVDIEDLINVDWAIRDKVKRRLRYILKCK
jgi:hypothetical protein